MDVARHLLGKDAPLSDYHVVAEGEGEEEGEHLAWLEAILVVEHYVLAELKIEVAAHLAQKEALSKYHMVLKVEVGAVGHSHLALVEAMVIVECHRLLELEMEVETEAVGHLAWEEVVLPKYYMVMEEGGPIGHLPWVKAMMLVECHVLVKLEVEVVVDVVEAELELARVEASMLVKRHVLVELKVGAVQRHRVV